MINLRPDEISDIIRNEIKNYDNDVSVQNIGKVLQVGDGIARVYGLEQVMAGDLVSFDDKIVTLSTKFFNSLTFPGQLYV